MKRSSSTPKENILKKIRQALVNPVPVPFMQSEGASNFIVPPRQELEVEFAENFTSLLGRFTFCADLIELAEQLAALTLVKRLALIHCEEQSIKNMLSDHGFDHFKSTDLSTCDAAITGCELLIARTGSLLLSSANESGRTTSVYAPVHICIAYTQQLVYDIKDGLQMLKDKYGASMPSFITLASGPSRTADIEKTLVVGIHGPKEVYVFLVDVQQ